MLSGKIITAILNLERRLAAPKKLELPNTIHGFTPQFDGYTKELDRYRRQDHGGGDDGDEWLDDDECANDFNEGKTKYQHQLDAVNEELKKAGFKPNARFELGEKGHFSIEIFKLEKAKK